MTLQKNSLTLSTRLARVPSIVLPGFPPTATGAIKKAARHQVSITTTSQQVGFMHAVMVEVQGKCVLLAGASGSGKTAYATFLRDLYGAKILANDWVGVEAGSDNALYVSDLNTPESLRHKARCKLDGVMVLTQHDQLMRDAYIPLQKEFISLIEDTFDTSSPNEKTTLSSFWKTNFSSLPFVFVLPVRARSEAYAQKTLQLLVDRLTPKQRVTVGVVGVGALGSQLAFQVSRLPFVKEVELYNPNIQKSVAYALDMNHASARNGDTNFTVVSNAKDIFKKADYVFLAFRDRSRLSGASYEPFERWQRFGLHAPIAKKFGALASAQNFKGTIFVLTNPVDILTYVVCNPSSNAPSSLRSFQVYGLGLQLDAARAAFFGRQVSPKFTKSSLRVSGNHADRLVLRTNLSEAQEEELAALVQGASSVIRQSLPRTTFGPAACVAELLDDFHGNRKTFLTVLEHGAYFGRQTSVYGGVPQTALTLSSVERELIEQNKQHIEKYRKLM